MTARTARRWLTLVAGLLVAVAAVLLAPDSSEDVAWSRPGADGWARGPYADAQVTSVRLARQIEGGFRELSTSAVFVVVELEVSAHRELAPTGDLTLRTADGHTYSQRDDISVTQVPAVEPGFTSSGTAVFELPPDRVAGADLVLIPHKGGLLSFRSGLRFDDVVPDGTPVQASVTPRSTQTWVTP